MEAITYHQLKTNLPIINRIETLAIQQEINKHATLKLTGIIDGKYEDTYVKQAEEFKSIEVYSEDEKSEYKILFRGVVRSELIRFSQGIYYLEIEGISFTYLLDLKKRKQSFQDAKLTHQNIIWLIMF